MTLRFESLGDLMLSYPQLESSRKGNMDKPRFPDKWDWHGCDAVEFNPEKMGGRATVGPFRFEADNILECFHAGMSVDQILEDYDFDREPARKLIENILAFAAAKGFQPTD